MPKLRSLRSRQEKWESGIEYWYRMGTKLAFPYSGLCQSLMFISQIAALHRQVQQAQQNQAAVDGALNYIEEQQKALDAHLTIYEKEVQSFSNDSSKGFSTKLPADKERENA
jgi:hypothetical protein